MKRLRLRKWVKITLIILAMATLIILGKKLDDDFTESCMNNGYSKETCLSNK